MYVVDVRPESNEVVLGADRDLYHNEVRIRNVNLISAASLDQPVRVTAKIRYNQKDSPALAVQTDDDEIVITFDEPQRAVTRGQAAVMYDGDIVVGGGVIA
jgi:tRNA-specific 2-thiouridylase